MIAVTGATGKLGQLAVQNLLKRLPASEIVAIVRDSSKAEGLRKLGVSVREANYDNAESWPKALQNIKKLLLISSSEIGKRESQHLNVIRGAQEAKIEHIVYTSILRAETSKLALATEHLATENEIKKSSLPYTILRNGWYLENHTENLAPVFAHGVLMGAAKDGKFSSASRNDYAEAAATVLTEDNHKQKTYELAGDQSFTLTELVNKLTDLTRKTIIYQDMSFEDYKKALTEVGVPEGFAYILADSDSKAADGGLESHSKDLSQLIKRPTTLLDKKIKEIL